MGSLIHVKGGRGLFFDGLFGDHIKWKVEWKYIEAYVHAPQECHDIECPYKEQCKCRSLYHKLSDNIKRIAAEPVYSPLKEVEIRLEQSLEGALNLGTNSINLIKAQTALGKTIAYCRIAQRWQGERPLMIAVPTLKLQEEVYRKLRIQYGVDADRTLSVIGFLEEFGEKDLQMRSYDSCQTAGTSRSNIKAI